MTIDTSMYGNIKPIQIESPLNQLAQVAQVQQAQNQNRLADLTFAQHKRALDSDTALASLLTPGAKPEDVAAGLASKGYGQASLAYTKQQQELAKQQADIGKTKADTQKSDWEVRKGVNGMIGSAAYAVSQNPTYENAQAIVAQLKQQLPPQFAASLDNMQIPQDPASLKQWATNHYLQSIETDKILADQTSRRNNDQNNATSIKTTAMNNATSLKTTAMNNAVQREQMNQPHYDADRGVLVNNNTGVANPVKSADGQPLPLKDAPQKIQDAKSVLNLIDMASPILDKANGGYVGTGISNTASALGINTDAANANAQLKALEGALVAKMPKMSGPQSDKDVLLYRQMAAQVGDSTVPIGQRKAALKIVKDITNKYLEGQGVTPAAPAGGALPNGWSVKEH